MKLTYCINIIARAIGIFQLLVFCSQPIFSATIRVPQDSATIASAIAAAVSGDVILLADGTYNEFNIVINKPLTLTSTGGRGLVMIDAQNRGGVIKVDVPDSETVVISGLTIKGGAVGGGWGGAIRRHSGGLNVYDCGFEGNYNNGGVIDGRNSDFTFDPSKTYVVNCIFKNNSAENFAGVVGVTAIKCLFHGNTGWNNPAVLVGSYAVNCTAYGNTGGALFNPWTTGGASGGTLVNCILWGNSGYQGQQIYFTSAVTYSLIQGGAQGVGNISSAPTFVNVDSGDFTLQANSPGVDVGDPTILDVDVSRSDMGAYGGSVPAPFMPEPILRPIITTQPTGQAIAYGASTTLSVVATANGTPTYQWRKDGVDIPNATSPTLTLNNVQMADGGSYTVEVTFGNSVTSNAAVVTVVPSVSPYGLIQGSYTWAEARVDAEARGGRLAVLNTQHKIDAASSYLATISASLDCPIVWIGLTDEIAEGQWKWITGETITANNWEPGEPNNLQNEDYAGIYPNAALTWNDGQGGKSYYLLEFVPPNITTQPIGQAIAYGASTTLSVVATASGTPAYQWQKDSVDIPSATSANLTLNNVQLSDAGSYTVVVTFGNSVTSSPAVVTVTPPAAWTLFNAAEAALPIADTGLVTLSPIDKMSVVTGAAARSGGNALKLQGVDDSSTYAERTIQGPAVVSFAWRVSSEEGFDFFRYSIDGVVQQSITGNGSWLERSLLIGAGTHTLRWIYEKDASDSNFEDAGYLDDVVVLPAYKDLQVKSGTEVLAGSSTLSFGTVQEQAADVSQTLDFKNTGTIPMAVTASLPVGCGFVFENQSLSVSITLPPGATQALGLVLKTTIPGAKSGLLTLTAADSQTPPPVITLSGFVQALTPNIACSWSGGGLTSGQGTAVDFGTTPRDITFTISNSGTAQLAIASVSIAPTADFQVISQPAASVAVGGNTTFTLRAVETTRGTHSATVTIASNAGNAPSFSFPVTSFSYLAVTGTGYTNGSFNNTGTSAGWSTAALALPGGGTGQVLKAGSTPHGGHSTIGATFEGPGLLRWNWQTSTQANYDWLVCEVNGAEVAGISTKNAAWQSQVVQIPAGAVVRWIYRKDASNTAGSDTGYISDISFNKFSATQTTFADWSAARGDLSPLQPLHPLGLQAMFAWLGGFEPDATLAAGYYQPLVSGGTYKYRYCVAKAAAGLVQPEISYDLATWSTRRMSQTVISEDANFAVVELSAPATGTVFSRLKAEQPAYTPPAPVMAYLGVLPDGTSSYANGVSADGGVVVGTSNNSSGNERAFRWTAAGTMVDLGTLPDDTSSYASGVSADGSVVVGSSANPSGDNSRAFRWTAAGGLFAIGVLPGGNYSVASGVSADGSVVVGWGRNSENNGRAFRWSDEGGMVDLGTLGGNYSAASGASIKGSVVVGYSTNSSGNYRAFKWTVAGGMVDLGVLSGGTESHATCVSVDGGVVVGSSNSSSGYRAFRWTASGGMVPLGTLGGNYSVATGVSADGSVVVGLSEDSSGKFLAFRWTAAGGMVGLGVLLGDTYSMAHGASADGSVVVGRSYGNSPFIRAFRWGRPSTAAPTNMAIIPAGSFAMGNSISTDTDITDAPVRTVTLDTYYIGKYEVTKAEWDEVRTWALSNGYSDLAAGAGKASNHPVQLIAWYDMVKWCNARSQKEGLMPAYYTNDTQTSIYKTGSVDVTNAQVKWVANGYRLPTEAEWEKAARGGLSGRRFPWGDTISHSYANYNADRGYSYDFSGLVGCHPTYATGVYPYTAPVGAFEANGYGLYNIAGNVSEWCWDWYGTYAAGALINPRGNSSGSFRVLRGGGWGIDASDLRVGNRSYYYPENANNYYAGGFRVVRSLVP